MDGPQVQGAELAPLPPKKDSVRAEICDLVRRSTPGATVKAVLPSKFQAKQAGRSVRAMLRDECSVAVSVRGQELYITRKAG